MTEVQTIQLRYFPPYDWETMLAYFRAHHLPDVEMVDETGFERVVRMRKGLGWFRVECRADRDCLSLEVRNGSEGDAAEISKVVRKMFDLDAAPMVIQRAMEADKFLSDLWTRHSGLRIGRAWSSSQALFSAVLGQVVSVSLGRVLTGELMAAAGPAVRHPKTQERIYLFPSPEQVLKADLSTIRTSEARRATIRSLALVIENGDLDRAAAGGGEALRKALRSVPGVGAWTAEYAAMRGFPDNDDAFPATDYVLKQELKRHPEMNVNAVRPWRGYAAIALWKSFAEAKRIASGAAAE